MIRVTIWNENMYEAVRKKESVLEHYPDGIHNYLASFLKDEFEVKTVTLFNDDGTMKEDAGITQELLDNTDVMIWWAHGGHRFVTDEAAQMVAEEVRKGMGMVFLHSAHLSKPFRFLMGTSCTLHWRNDGDWERVWVVAPSHPITQGIGEYIRVPHDEVYAEPFGIPEPDQLVFITAYEGGEVFRSGCCWTRENGKIFYFQPGHETFPVYHQPDIQTVIKNGIRWVYTPRRVAELTGVHISRPQD